MIQGSWGICVYDGTEMTEGPEGIGASDPKMEGEVPEEGVNMTRGLEKNENNIKHHHLKKELRRRPPIEGMKRESWCVD